MANEKLLTVLRGLSPAALRAVIDELSKLGPPARHAGDGRTVVAPRTPRRPR